MPRFHVLRVLTDEKAATCAASFARALERFAAEGVTFEKVMTNNHLEFHPIDRVRCIRTSTSRVASIVPHWSSERVRFFEKILIFLGFWIDFERLF